MFAVAFDRDQIASRYTSKASVAAKWSNLSMIPSSMIYFTWFSFPAQIFDKVHAASFLIICSSFSSKGIAASKKPHWITYSVYSSDPVTKFPIVLREGMQSDALSPCIVRLIIFGVMPVSIINGIVA